MMVSDELLLKKNHDRFVLFPIKYHDIWRKYKEAESSFWNLEEIDFSKDDWESLNDNEKVYLSHILAFFAASDGIVNENLVENMMSQIEIPEVRCFYGFQIMMENIHSEVYSMLIELYITDRDQKKHLFNAIETIPVVKRKADFALKYLKNDSDFVEKLVAFACVELISFSSSFGGIFYMRKKGAKLDGLFKSNEFISRDEGMHGEFAILLYVKYVQHKLPKEKIIEIISECVDIERDFVTEAIPVSLLGMNADLMVQYVEYVADRLCYSLGYHDKIYNVRLPDGFEFMENISLERKTNFFEHTPSEYQKSNVMNSLLNTNTVGMYKFEINEDF